VSPWYGAAIDSHSFVLRMNVAPTGGALKRHVGRGVHSSTFQLKLSRFGHTSRVPLSNRLGENHAPNVSHKMGLR